MPAIAWFLLGGLAGWTGATLRAAGIILADVAKRKAAAALQQPTPTSSGHCRGAWG